ncbi:MAG: hypothetical protein ASARMPREDX12_001476 [Alectoria sarmentosa]|nr:MAG: hypothetical protein ASARMPREDX12_001476 [Alectoria sarmentosa]
MASPTFTIFEEITTFDIVWQRISEDSFEVQTGPGEPDEGMFTVKRASPPSLSSPTPSTSSIPMIATFTWEQFSAEFACDYNQTSRSYGNFDLVDGSMNEHFWISFRVANAFNRNAQPDLWELDGSTWKLEMSTMCNGPNTSYVELWAKKRFNDEPAEETESDRRKWGVGQYASVDEEEDGGEWEIQERDASEDESDEEGEDEDGGEGEDQEVDASEEASDVEGEEEEENSDA